MMFVGVKTGKLAIQMVVSVAKILRFYCKKPLLILSLFTRRETGVFVLCVPLGRQVCVGKMYVKLFNIDG